MVQAKINTVESTFMIIRRLEEMVCPSCGNPIHSPDHDFCTKCGNYIKTLNARTTYNDRINLNYYPTDSQTMMERFIINELDNCLWIYNEKGREIIANNAKCLPDYMKWVWLLAMTRYDKSSLADILFFGKLPNPNLPIKKYLEELITLNYTNTRGPKKEVTGPSRIYRNTGVDCLFGILENLRDLRGLPYMKVPNKYLTSDAINQKREMQRKIFSKSYGVENPRILNQEHYKIGNIPSCPKCGTHKTRENQNFCTNCGTNLEKIEVQEQKKARKCPHCGELHHHASNYVICPYCGCNMEDGYSKNLYKQFFESEIGLNDPIRWKWEDFDEDSILNEGSMMVEYAYLNNQKTGQTKLIEEPKKYFDETWGCFGPDIKLFKAVTEHSNQEILDEFGKYSFLISEEEDEVWR